MLTFTTSAVQTTLRGRELRERGDSSLSLILATFIIPLGVIAFLAVATLLT